MDPLDEFEYLDRRYADRLSRLPRCEICDSPIQQDKAVYYNSQWFCRSCEHDFWDDIRYDFLEDVALEEDD